MATQPEQTVTSQDPQGTDAGTDAAARPLSQTQTTPYNAQGNQVGRLTGPIVGFAETPAGAVTGVIRAPRSTVPPPAVGPGAGAVDDAGLPLDLSQARSLQDLQTQWSVKPQPNILDQYPSYTWQASVYMLTPQQVDAFRQNPRRRPNSYNLLFQSGGAAKSTSPNVGRGPTAGTAQAFNQDTDGRNPFFSEDFYIDNIRFKSIAAGKGSGFAQASAELKFSVTEPANISLLDRLVAAAQDLQPVTGQGRVNYASVTYLMIIRFWAMDQTGKIIQVGAKTGYNDGALVEKYFPFRIRGISYTISSSLVTYEWDCTPESYFVGSTTRWNTVQAAVELTGASVDDLLNGISATGYDSRGFAVGQVVRDETGAVSNFRRNPETGEIYDASGSTAAPAKANTTLTNQGLMAYLNEQQQQNVSKGIRRVADQYRIQYTPEAESLIKSATVRKPSSTVSKTATPMAAAASQNTQAASPDKGAMDVTSRNFAVVAGQQVVQVIENIIRNSSYITDQANVIFDEETNLPKANPKAAGRNRGFKWFNIIPSYEKLDLDENIGDYAYRITYTISTFNVALLSSNYFADPVFPGLHKRYPYWFTGQNTAVLDYKETFNYDYQITVTGDSPDNTVKKQFDRSMTSSMVVIPYVTVAARSNESSQGAQGRANELAANAAENLYNPADLGSVKLTILGDPAWIMQGSILNPGPSSVYDSRGFNSDGSINFDTEQVLFEVVWQKPEDFDLKTGLADPYSRIQAKYNTRQALQSRVYVATIVSSEFVGGSFTQVIEGTTMWYPVNTQNSLVADAGDDFSQGEDTQGFATVNTAANTVPEQPVDDQREFNRLPPPSRTNATTPTVATSSETTAAGIGESVAAAQSFFSSAQLQNAAGGAPALKITPTVRMPNLQQSQGFFPGLADTAADTLQPAVPAGPVISDGVAVGTADTLASANQLQISGQIVNGAVQGAVVINGQSIAPGAAGYADAVNQLLRSQARAEARVSQPQDMSREA